jgi:hypothetical protein
MRIVLRVSLGLGIAAMLGACGSSNNNPTGPSNSTVAGFFTSATASDGTSAQVQTGSAPTPNGGPSITVSAPNTVVVGTQTVVRIQSSLPFSKVFASVDGVTGFLQLSLKAPTTDTTLVVNVASSVSNSMFTADYRVASPTGSVGAASTVPSVASQNTSPSSNIAGTWAAQGTPTSIVNLVFAQSGANVTGNENFPVFQGTGFSASGVISGIVSGNVFTATNTQVFSVSVSGTSVQCGETDGLTLQISGSSMTGTYTSGTLTCNSNGFTAPAQLPFTTTLIKQ